jgi:hypothetical protein
MKLCIVVEMDDVEDRVTIDRALQAAGQLAGCSVYNHDNLQVDEERDLFNFDPSFHAKINLFRPE